MGAVAKSARADNVRLNQLRAKQQAAERRRRLTIAIAATAAVVVVVAVLVGVAPVSYTHLTLPTNREV